MAGKDRKVNLAKCPIKGTEEATLMFLITPPKLSLLSTFNQLNQQVEKRSPLLSLN